MAVKDVHGAFPTVDVPDHAHYTIGTVILIVGITGTLGNFLVIYAFCRYLVLYFFLNTEMNFISIMTVLCMQCRHTITLNASRDIALRHKVATWLFWLLINRGPLATLQRLTQIAKQWKHSNSRKLTEIFLLLAELLHWTDVIFCFSLIYHLYFRCFFPPTIYFVVALPPAPYWKWLSFSHFQILGLFPN